MASKRQLVNAMKAEFEAMMGRQQPSAIQAAVDAKFHGNKETQAAMRQFMAEHCRNCLINSVAVARHNRTQCRAMGNRPCNPCSRCAARGILDFCWPEDCKK